MIILAFQLGSSAGCQGPIQPQSTLPPATATATATLPPTATSTPTPTPTETPIPTPTPEPLPDYIKNAPNLEKFGLIFDSETASYKTGDGTEIARLDPDLIQPIDKKNGREIVALTFDRENQNAMEKLQEITADYQNNPYVIFSPLPVVVNPDIEVSIGKMPEGFTTGQLILSCENLNYVVVQPKDSSPENITSFDLIYPFADKNKKTIPVAYVGTWSAEDYDYSTTDPESIFFNGPTNQIYGKVVFFNQDYVRDYFQKTATADQSKIFEYGSFPDELRGNSVYDLSKAPVFVSYRVIIPPYGIDPDFNWADTSQEVVKKINNTLDKTYFNKQPGNYVPYLFYINENGKTSQPVYNAEDRTMYSRINITNNTPFNFAETTTTVNFSGGPAILQIITGFNTTFYGKNDSITYQFSPDLKFLNKVSNKIPHPSSFRELYEEVFSLEPLYLLVITEGTNAP